MANTTTSIDFITNSSISTDNTTHVTEDRPHDFRRHDHTLIVSLVVMGVIVPSIFIFMFVMICKKHRQSQQSRRSTMLLRNGPEVPMDDIPLSIRTNLENGRL